MSNSVEWREKNRGRINLYMLKYRYGLTAQEFEEMKEAQGQACALCSSTQKLCVDHDHTTSRVRGLLCHFCNSMLGRFKDDRAQLAEGAARIQTYLIVR